MSLYGHPLAGLYWQLHCEKAIFACGFTRVQGWECLYKHKEDKLFLSVYVDDFKMVGDNRARASMWTKLQKHLLLEEPVPVSQNTYLGCGQYECKISEEMLAQKQEAWNTLYGIPKARAVSSSQLSEQTGQYPEWGGGKGLLTRQNQKE